MPALETETTPIPALQTPAPLAKSRSHADMGTHASPLRLQGPGGGRGLSGKPPTKKASDVAKTSPGEFVNQVRAEARKVVWPSRKETVTTAVMVLIMTTILAIFFLGIDAFFSTIVKYLLGLIGS